MSTHDIRVRCSRCRNEHMESERVSKLRKGAHGLNILCCPRCNGTSFYDLRPQVAWCWATGLIEVGDVMPKDIEGAIKIASGPKFALKSRLLVVALNGYGESSGKLFVPGVPEADDQKAKGDALATWLKWCGRTKGRNGVVFCQEAL